MATKRARGDGGIDQRGPDTFRLRYRVNGKRHSVTFRGTMSDARRELRRLLRSGDTGDHVDPTKITVSQWVDQWIGAGAPGRKKKKVGQRTLERYEELLKVHIKPKLGARPLQKLAANEIDGLYLGLDGRIAPRTAHHVHVVFNSCLSTAERKGLLRANPMRRVEQVPSPGESDHGLALDESELTKLIAGFKASLAMYAPVAIAAATGVRRNELLALRWSDFIIDQKTLKIERALEDTKKFGIRIKPPKTVRGLRTLSLDEKAVAILLREKEQHLRIMAGVANDASIDLSLIRLPPDALIFPASPKRGKDFSFTVPRDPGYFTKAFAIRAKKLGFAGFKFHHLRGTHATLLLDRGIPVHVVADRIGDDPAVLLRNYAKRKRANTADNSVAAALTALAAGFLGS
ncbi:MAG: site-specific integrase [Pseudolabrys sp.]|nr:site-specific integrase [Pseudolabrys sp.]